MLRQTATKIYGLRNCGTRGGWSLINNTAVPKHTHGYLIMERPLTVIHDRREFHNVTRAAQPHPESLTGFGSFASSLPAS